MVAAVVLALLYALFVWWFSTGLVLLLVLRCSATKASLVGAAVLFPASLGVIAFSSARTGVALDYYAFTAAIVLWGTLETAFLTGVITGPRPLPCPPGARGLRRFGFAVRAIIYHELSLVATGLVVLVLTWGEANQVAALTFLVLWVMRLSAKLNLYLGVPVLNDEAMPQPIAHLRSYFSRGPASGFFPVALISAVIAACFLIAWAFDEAAGEATEVGYALVAALLVLAILEHLFMIVPLPIDRLWRWSTRAPRQPSRAAKLLRSERRRDLERVASTGR